MGGGGKNWGGCGGGRAREALHVELGGAQLGAHGAQDGAAVVVQIVHVAPGTQELPHLPGACVAGPYPLGPGGRGARGSVRRGGCGRETLRTDIGNRCTWPSCRYHAPRAVPAPLRKLSKMRQQACRSSDQSRRTALQARFSQNFCVEMPRLNGCASKHWERGGWEEGGGGRGPRCARHRLGSPSRGCR